MDTSSWKFNRGLCLNTIIDISLGKEKGPKEVHARITALRQKMNLHGIDAWIIATADPHNCEYPPDHWQSRKWLSGFTGSAGTLAVLKNEALLWTDGRYHIQAENELSATGITLIKEGLPDVLSLSDWLAENVPEGITIGFDGTSMPHSRFEAMQNKLEHKNVSFITDTDLLENIWQDRPAPPSSPVFEHEQKYAGKSTEQKILEVKELMAAKSADWFLISSLDDIAWLFNFRGSDLQNCSTAISYTLLSKDQTWLCIDSSKVPEALLKTLTNSGISVVDYNTIFELTGNIPKEEKVYLDKSTTSTHLFNCIDPDCQVISGINFTTDLKAVKNETEIANFRDCLIRDGAYVLKFMKWLEDNYKNSTEFTELDAVAHLNSLRAEDELFHDRSFETIAGFGANAALMHYMPLPETNATITDNNFLLVDSGGLYKDGTTDITRTFPFGKLTEEQIRDYTLVVKGHINLARAVFMKGCRGAQIDYAARADMWREGINYNCSTGHGVGFFLNVHEGPQNIGQRLVDVELKPGMIITNEPGIYKAGRHGIRIENIMLCYEKETTEFGTFHAFETISPCPIDTTAIDSSMLSREEINWLNYYHETVYDQLSPLLDEEHKEFLKMKTAKI